MNLFMKITCFKNAARTGTLALKSRKRTVVKSNVERLKRDLPDGTNIKDQGTNVVIKLLKSSPDATVPICYFSRVKTISYFSFVWNVFVNLHFLTISAIWQNGEKHKYHDFLLYFQPAPICAAFSLHRPAHLRALSNTFWRAQVRSDLFASFSRLWSYSKQPSLSKSTGL